MVTGILWGRPHPSHISFSSLLLGRLGAFQPTCRTCKPSDGWSKKPEIRPTLGVFMQAILKTNASHCRFMKSWRKKNSLKVEGLEPPAFSPSMMWIFRSQTSGCFQSQTSEMQFSLHKRIIWVVPLPRIPVTTRIITFLVGDPYKHSFATVTGRGDNPTDNTSPTWRAFWGGFALIKKSTSFAKVVKGGVTF